MFLRRALEGETVAMLAARRDPDLLVEVERNLRYQDAAVQADDRQGFHRLDLEFHDLLISAVGYPRMRATVEHARLALDRVRRLLFTPRRHAASYAEHRAIFEAMRDGKPDMARAAMAGHIDSVMNELEAFSISNPDVFADRQGYPQSSDHELDKTCRPNAGASRGGIGRDRGVVAGQRYPAACSSNSSA